MLIQNRIAQLNEMNPDVADLQQRFDLIKSTMLRDLTKEWLFSLEKMPTQSAFSPDKIQSLIDQMSKLENADTESVRLLITEFQSSLDILIPIVRIALANEEITFLEDSCKLEFPETLHHTKDKANTLINEAKSVEVDTSELQRRLDAISI
jgi:hypothetical protein